MPYTVALYSPDTHVAYDGNTPDQRGIGGGVTSRVRLLRALARLGHTVTAYVNCDRPGDYHGVTYRRFDDVTRIEADVLIGGTSGGRLDFSPLGAVRLDAPLLELGAGFDPELTGRENVFLNSAVLASPGVTPRSALTALWTLPACARSSTCRCARIPPAWWSGWVLPWPRTWRSRS